MRSSWRRSSRDGAERPRSSRGLLPTSAAGFSGSWGLVKATALLAFTLTAHNLYRIRSFRAKYGLDESAQVVESPKRRRTPRRPGTWRDIVESEPAPPPT